MTLILPRNHASDQPGTIHYAVDVRVCPAYRANRKGAVEKSNHFIAQRWWRTCDVATAGEAQVSLDGFLAGPGDARVRHVDGRRTTVGALGDAEPLRAAPDRAFPAVVRTSVTVASDATVAFEGNRYGVPPSMIGQPVVVRHRLGTTTVEVAAGGGLVVAAHDRATPGGHRVVRSDGQRAALERVVLAAASGPGGRPCHRKPPGSARPCSPSHSATPRSTPATAPTTPPPRTSPRAATRPR